MRPSRTVQKIAALSFLFIILAPAVTSAMPRATDEGANLHFEPLTDGAGAPSSPRGAGVRPSQTAGPNALLPAISPIGMTARTTGPQKHDDFASFWASFKAAVAAVDKEDSRLDDKAPLYVG